MQKCMGALKRSQCGLVEIRPTNDHVVLQAHPSWQDYSKKPKDICTDRIIGTRKGIESLMRDFLTKNNKQINWC